MRTSFSLSNFGFSQASNPSYSLKRTLKKSYLTSTLVDCIAVFHPFYYILTDVIVVILSSKHLE